MDEPPKPGKGPKPLGDRKSVLSSDLNFSSLGARLSGYLWKHRRRVLFLSVFSAGYFCVVQGVRSGQRDLLRAGLAGASANMICEMSFHTFDTINTRTKVHHTPISSIIMSTKIWNKEGVYGFAKGISATFYGSLIAGFVYFTFYKYLKEKFIASKEASFMQFFMCSVLSEIFTLLFYYPYDLIKSRLQTRNFHFKYKNLVHAFRSVIKKEGTSQLYKGSFPYLLMYGLYVPLQFACYETIMLWLEKRFGSKKEGQEKPLAFIVVASILAGGFAAFITNPFETVTAQMQVQEKDQSILSIIRKQKLAIVYRGIGMRTAYNAMQTVLFFLMVDQMGKYFRVDLTGID